MTERHERFEPQEGFKIETLTVPDGREVSYSPERGGIITSLKLGGRELLYMDKETFADPDKSVKGGIPILFPNAGPLTSERFPGLKQHGFARNSEWTVMPQTEENKFSEELSASEKSMAVFPYNFKLIIQGAFEKDGSFTLEQLVSNREPENPMPISMGLHPYFKVPNGEKHNVKFKFPGGEVAEQDAERWMNGEAVFLANPKLGDPDAEVRVVIPSLGTLVFDISEDYRRVWVWSQPEKDFICVEPVMRDPGGLVNDPVTIRPNSTFETRLNIKLMDKENE